MVAEIHAGGGVDQDFALQVVFQALQGGLVGSRTTVNTQIPPGGRRRRFPGRDRRPAQFAAFSSAAVASAFQPGASR